MGHQLPEEYDAPAVAARTQSLSHVESEVDLFKSRRPGRNAEYPQSRNRQAHRADERVAVEPVDLETSREQPSDCAVVNRPGKQGQILPVGGYETG